MKFPFSVLMLCLCFIAADSFAQSALKLAPFSSGLTRAVDIVGGSDDRLYIIQQRGPVRIVDQRGVLLPDFFIDM
jgi:hypothetical protein